MKTARSVVLVSASMSMLAAGWVAGSGFLNPTGSANSPAALSASDLSAASGTVTAAATGTFDGDSVRTRYGSYQAEITVADGVVTDISMLQSGNSDGTSQQISAYALPQLISAVLQKQTFNVGYVSGASYTTQGFESTVQSAMQAAGLA